MASFHAATPDTVYISSSPQDNTRTPDIHKIHEWFVWSILNIFLGWSLCGIIPFIFTMLCRYNKRSNDLKRSQTMSKLALIFNIIVTLGGITGWIILIILLVRDRRMQNNLIINQ
jgi:hypothetical protein